jgi:hypothetical protein
MSSILDYSDSCELIGIFMIKYVASIVDRYHNGVYNWLKICYYVIINHNCQKAYLAKCDACKSPFG